MHEDEVDTAIHWLEEFKKNPEDPCFIVKEHPIDTQGIAEDSSAEEGGEKEPLPLRAIRLREKVRPKMPLTRFIVLICALFYIWNGYQMADIAKKIKIPSNIP